MEQIKETNRCEFGDFQTPVELAQKAMTYLRKFNHDLKPKTIIEPTCGVGAFLLAAADLYPDAERIIGLEIDAEYINAVQSDVAKRADVRRFELIEADFFRTDWESLFAKLPEPFLVIGNPPWVTSSDISRLEGNNLPEKSNFQKNTGFEALTGKANFDISEWMLMQILKWIRVHKGCMAMLCKTSVARKLLRYAWNENFLEIGSRMVQIDTAKYFSVSVDACFFSLKTKDEEIPISCQFFDCFDKTTPSAVLEYYEGILLSHADKFHKHREFLGHDDHYVWRSGIKHDCSKVMELRKDGGSLKNGYGKLVEIEELCKFPLLKSSDLSNKKVKETRLEVIVTQKKVGQLTDYIRSQAPMTWKYLEKNSLIFVSRKSSIYRNKPKFSIFGVGSYTFTDWKVAISGFYKRLEFQVVGPISGKPVIFDDTVYFLSAKTRTEAKFLADLLNSPPSQAFLESMVFWSDKRPVTIELLKRLDIRKLSRHLNREDEYTDFIGRCE